MATRCSCPMVIGASIHGQHAATQGAPLVNPCKKQSRSAAAAKALILRTRWQRLRASCAVGELLQTKASAREARPALVSDAKTRKITAAGTSTPPATSHTTV